MVLGSQQHTLLELNMDRVHTIDTRSLEDLSGMWKVFSKTAEALENGKRLENLSWRLWNRETFCCCPVDTKKKTSRASILSAARDAPPSRKSSHIPDLASSLETVDSDSDGDDDDRDGTSPSSSSSSSAVSNILRPELVRLDSTNGLRTQKHITTGTLEKIVVSIKETQEVEPKELDLPDLPALSSSPPFVVATAAPPAAPAAPAPRAAAPAAADEDDDEEAASVRRSKVALAPPHQPSLQTQNLPTRANVRGSFTTNTTAAAVSNPITGSPSVAASSDASSAAMSTHEVVRGFVPGGRPSSYRSQTQLAQPTPILKNSPRDPPRSKQQKGALFTLGASSGEDESSLESHVYKSSLSSLSEGLHRQAGRKQASFRDENLVSKIQDSPVFESDDEDDDDDDDDVSDGVIEDDEEEDSSDWEDDLADDDRSVSDDAPLFRRVDSRPNLPSRRSLLTSLMHEGDRAAALQNAASKSTPAIRRAHTSPSEASTRASSPARAMNGPDGCATTALPIARNAASLNERLALSPRTTRRNMLSSELTESLRRNLLWERQHKSTQNLAALRRRHTSHDVKNLKQFPDPVNLSRKDNQIEFTNDYFHAGLGEYHSKGW